MGRRKRIGDDELLAVAREVFVERGVAASTREIARRAGCSEAVLYQRHGTKIDLFLRAMAPPALDVEALLDAPADAHGPRAHLEAIALGMLDYFRRLAPVLQPLLSDPEFDFEAFARRHPDAPLQRMRAGLMATLERMQARGELRPQPIGPAALTLFAAIHSLALFERMGAHGGRFDEATVRGMVGALWDGLAP